MFATMILRESLTLAALGVVVSLPLVLATTRFASAQLFGISPHDPQRSVAAVLLLAAVAALASFIPARRAAPVDPMVALRYE